MSNMGKRKMKNNPEATNRVRSNIRSEEKESDYSDLTMKQSGQQKNSIAWSFTECQLVLNFDQENPVTQGWTVEGKDHVYYDNVIEAKATNQTCAGQDIEKKRNPEGDRGTNSLFFSRNAKLITVEEESNETNMIEDTVAAQNESDKSSDDEVCMTTLGNKELIYTETASEVEIVSSSSNDTEKEVTENVLQQPFESPNEAIINREQLTGVTENVVEDGTDDKLEVKQINYPLPDGIREKSSTECLGHDTSTSVDPESSLDTVNKCVSDDTEISWDLLELPSPPHSVLETAGEGEEMFAILSPPSPFRDHKEEPSSYTDMSTSSADKGNAKNINQPSAELPGSTVASPTVESVTNETIPENAREEILNAQLPSVAVEMGRKLNNHEESCDPIKQLFKCTQCEKVYYANESRMQRHNKQYHRGKAKFIVLRLDQPAVEVTVQNETNVNQTKQVSVSKGAYESPDKAIGVAQEVLEFLTNQVEIMESTSDLTDMV